MLSFYDYLHMFASFWLEIVVCAVLLMRKRTDFRKGASWRIPVGVAVSLGMSGASFALANIMPWNTWTNILVYTMLFLSIIGAFLLVYKEAVKETLLVCLVAYTMQHMVYQVSVLVFDTGLKDSMNASLDYGLALAIYTVALIAMRIGCYVVLYFALVRLFRKNSRFLLRSGYVIGLAICVYAVAVMANAAAHNLVDQTNYWLVGMIAGVLLLCCILFNFFIVGGFKLAEHKEESLLMKSTYEAKMTQYEMTQKNIDFINMKCHDLRKFVRALREKQERLTDEEYQIIEDSLRIYDTGMRTGSPTLDTLFQDKALYCKARGIELTILVDGSLFESFRTSDVHFLFMNILDNAIEAVEKVEEPSRKIISLTSYSKQGAIIIEEMNYFDGEIKTNEDGSLASSKKDVILHGYGSKSIAYITKKYEGELTIDINEGIFQLRIVF